MGSTPEEARRNATAEGGTSGAGGREKAESLSAGNGSPSLGASLALTSSSGVRFLDPLPHPGFRMILDPAIGQE